MSTAQLRRLPQLYTTETRDLPISDLQRRYLPMKIIFLTLLLVMFCTFRALPQERGQGSITGQVRDSASHQPLMDASVVLLQAKDSPAVATTFVDAKGSFRLTDLRAGSYQLVISYLGYQQTVRQVVIETPSLQVDLGLIDVRRTGLTLAAVEVVEQKSPMVVRKDTLEFDADYFKTRENALMEELLRKLPGIQIERDGTIKMNGVPVKRIMVNGKPLFDDDVTLITRNLSAAIIDKVQLFDDWSDRSELGGRTHEPKDQVINITIKEEAKNRFSGRAVAGYGTIDRFSVNGSLNRFTDKEHLSIIGAGNNDNGYQESNGGNMGGGSEGITRSWNGAANYSRFFSKKLQLNSSYVANSRQIDNERTSFRQNLLPDTTYYYEQRSKSTINTVNQELNLHMAYEPDTTQKFVAMAKLGRTDGRNLADNIFATLGGGKEPVNQGITRNSSTDQKFAFSSSLFYDKRFRKPGHVFRSDLTIDFGDNTQDGYLKSDNLFLQPNGEIDADTINQHNETNGSRRRIHGRLVYLVPLSKGYSLGLAYLFTHDHTATGKFAYDYNAEKGNYDRLNDSLSNQFENTTNVHWLYMQIKATKNKHDFDIGLNLQLNNIDNYNINENIKLQQCRFNIIPLASWAYALTESNSIGVSYEGEVRLPGVAELQPVIDNSNPLYIQQGNPALKPAYTHNIYGAYSTRNTATMRSMTASVGATIVNNKIINASWFDSLGRQISQPLNVNGSYNINASIANVFPLTKWRTFVNTNTSLLLSRDIGYMNNLSSSVNTVQVNQELSFNYTYKELIELRTMARAGYRGVRYLLQEGSNSHFMDYSLSLDGNVNLPLGISTGGSLYYILGTGRSAGYNPNIAMLSLQVSKTVLRKQGLIKIQGFDLLNQNRSLTMRVGENYIEEVRAKVLQRFFVVGFSWFIK